MKRDFRSPLLTVSFWLLAARGLAGQATQSGSLIVPEKGVAGRLVVGESIRSYATVLSPKPGTSGVYVSTSDGTEVTVRQDKIERITVITPEAYTTRLIQPTVSSLETVLTRYGNPVVMRATTNRLTLSYPGIDFTFKRTAGAGSSIDAAFQEKVRAITVRAGPRPGDLLLALDSIRVDQDGGRGSVFGIGNEWSFFITANGDSLFKADLPFAKYDDKDHGGHVAVGALEPYPARSEVRLLIEGRLTKQGNPTNDTRIATGQKPLHAAREGPGSTQFDSLRVQVAATPRKGTFTFFFRIITPTVPTASKR